MSEAFDEAARVQCAKAFECMSTYPDTDFAQRYGASEDACVQMYSGLFDQIVPDYEASVDAGRIDFDSGDAQACIDFQEGLACDVYWTTTAPDSCDTAFTGTVASGGDCTLDDDCAADTDFCDPTTNTCTAG